MSRPNENGQGERAALGGGEKDNLIPSMLLVGSISTVSKSKKSKQTLADPNLEMEVIIECGSGGLHHYKPSRTNMA